MCLLHVFFKSVPLTLSFYLKISSKPTIRKITRFTDHLQQYHMGPFSGIGHLCCVCWLYILLGCYNYTLYWFCFVFIYRIRWCIHVSNLLRLLYSSATFVLVVVSIFFKSSFGCGIHLLIFFLLLYPPVH